MLWIELEHDGVTGFGEAQPQDHYGETVESAEAFLDEAGSLLGDDPFALEAIGDRLAEVPGQHAAKAGLDGALHDLCGKLVGQPVWQAPGPRAGRPADLVDDLARRPRRHGTAGGGQSAATFAA